MTTSSVHRWTRKDGAPSALPDQDSSPRHTSYARLGLLTVGDERDLARPREDAPRGDPTLELGLEELHDAFCMTSDDLPKQAFQIERLRILHARHPR